MSNQFLNCGITQGIAPGSPKGPTSPSMPVSVLIDALRNKVFAKDMEVINMHYLQFRVCSVKLALLDSVSVLIDISNIYCHCFLVITRQKG